MHTKVIIILCSILFFYTYELAPSSAAETHFAFNYKIKLDGKEINGKKECKVSEYCLIHLEKLAELSILYPTYYSNRVMIKLSCQSDSCLIQNGHNDADDAIFLEKPDGSFSSAIYRGRKAVGLEYTPIKKIGFMRVEFLR